jgi:hypothetical protein
MMVAMVVTMVVAMAMIVIVGRMAIGRRGRHGCDLRRGILRRPGRRRSWVSSPGAP